MIIKLCKNLSSDNTLIKDIEVLKEIEIKARNNFNITNPVINLSPIDGVDILDIDYIIIDDLNRSYIVNDIIQLQGKIFQVSCVCDVLSSFPDLVKGSYAEYNRAIKEGDYFQGSLDMSYQTNIEKFESDGELVEGEQIIMTTLGAK